MNKIDIEDLLKVSKIIVHKYCHDGLASAMIIRDVLPMVDIFFADHKDSEYLNMESCFGLLFCDISPPPNRESEFLKVNSIVLDHHEKTKDIVRKFEHLQLGVYGDNSKQESGAMLAYKHVWLPLKKQAKTSKDKVFRVARLAGIRDTYFNSSIEWDDACIQTEVLAFFPITTLLHKNHGCEINTKELEIGKIQHDKFKDTVNRAVNSAYIFEWNSIKIAIISGYRVISDAAEVFRKNGIPITLAFSFKSEHGTNFLTCSARSDENVFNCNIFANNWGGGGHAPAAGGIMIALNEDTLNPYTLLENMIREKGLECLVKK